MNEKHTPGPWTIKERVFIDDLSIDDPVDTFCYGLISANGECVIGIQPNANMRLAERFANVSLIESAPDLLQALKSMVKAHPIPSTVCKERPAYEAALSAIAKATGEAS